MTRPACFVSCAVCAVMLGGCVERTVRITTQPAGAVVLVNDEEVGVSPVKFNFLWYGTYDIIVRKEGYKTLKTSQRIDPPWYQIPPIDLIAEHFVIGTIHDDHELPEYALEKADPPAINDVVGRAVEMRDRTLYEGGK